MPQTALLTLGRLPKALDIAEALSKAGWRVIVAEPFSWHLCRVSRYVSKSFKVTAPNTDQTKYLEELLHIVKREGVSLVVPVSEEAVHATLIAPDLPPDVRMYSVPQIQLQELHDKYRFNQLASSLGLTVPETYLLGTPEAHQLAQQQDYVLKPVFTCSGKGFSIHSRGTALPNSLDLPTMVVQQKLNGPLKSTFSIVEEGRVLGTVVYKAAVLSGTVAVAFERIDHESRVKAWVQHFAKETGYSGFLSFDMIEDEDGKPHAIECNPRATSGIHFVTRQSLADAILRPDLQQGLAFRPFTVMQQFFPCLTETQTALFRRDDFLKKSRTLFSAKDVNFSLKDPLPLWLMPFTSWEIMKRSFIEGQSFGEASTFDIAWFG
ncbi:MAG: ATP-grasp domain-containing protein [Pseudomonadota bacterium]